MVWKAVDNPGKSIRPPSPPTPPPTLLYHSLSLQEPPFYTPHHTIPHYHPLLPFYGHRISISYATLYLPPPHPSPTLFLPVLSLVFLLRTTWGTILPSQMYLTSSPSLMRFILLLDHIVLRGDDNDRPPVKSLIY